MLLEAQVGLAYNLGNPATTGRNHQPLAEPFAAPPGAGTARCQFAWVGEGLALFHGQPDALVAVGRAMAACASV